MHYKNGRKAKLGDMVITRNYAGCPLSGVVVTAHTESDACNLRVIPFDPATMFYATASETLHVDDVLPVVDPAADIVPPVTGNAPVPAATTNPVE